MMHYGRKAKSIDATFRVPACGNPHGPVSAKKAHVNCKNCQRTRAYRAAKR